MAFTQRLPAVTVHNTGFTHKARLTAADVRTLTKATQYGLFPVYNSTSLTFPAGTIIEKVHVNVLTLGTNGANTLTFSLGQGGGNAARYVNAMNLKTTSQSVGSSIQATPFVLDPADSLDFQIDTDAADLTAVGALDMEVYIRAIDINPIEVDSGPLGT